MRRALAAALLFLSPLALPAQEFRVYTAVSDLGGKAPAEVSRSLTLFHAGQAWDHVAEAGEVIRFDPAAAEFVILDTNRDLACTVSLEELTRLLDVGRRETEKALVRLAGDPLHRGLAANLGFQLAPEYELTADDATKRLTFASDPVTYEVDFADPGRPAVSAAYLDYAGWTGKLNFVLDPGKLYPEVRRPVHEALRERAAVPQRVAVTLNGLGDPGAPPVRLAADHTFAERLDPRDRQLISEWRDRLASPKTRVVTFREYQRLTLRGKAVR